MVAPLSLRIWSVSLVGEFCKVTKSEGWKRVTKKGMNKMLFMVSIQFAKSGENPVIGAWFSISIDKSFLTS